MFQILQLITLSLVTLAMVTAVAHALELPGKLRLPRETYLQVQPIYYPGFTVVGGAGEVLGIIATLTLAGMSYGMPQFPLVAGAFLCLLVMHAVYWAFTHPVNEFWLRQTSVGRAGGSFFAFGAGRDGEGDWTVMRDRWEYSHVARSVLSAAAFLMLAISLVMP